MPVYFRAPLPGPFGYSRRVSGKTGCGPVVSGFLFVAVVGGLVLSYPWIALGVAGAVLVLVVTLAIVARRRRRIG